MQAVQEVVFVANDGTRFTSASRCLIYEQEKESVSEAMRNIPEWPTDNTFIQLDRAELYDARRKLWALILAKYGDSWPQWKGFDADDVHPFSAVGRVMSECDNCPLAKAWNKFGAINFDNCRMYQQPFYALNLDKAPK